MELDSYFKKAGIKFYVIGATARDIIMEIHHEKSARLTHDLDIAIAIDAWDEFAQVEEGLVGLPDFTKDTKQKQRFLYQNKFQIDIVPFGQIMREGDKIFWPPDEHFAMVVLGFAEVNKNLIPIRIDDHLSIEIASLAGIFVLKVFAWSDRNHRDNRDAADLGFIMSNYLSINEERAVADYFTEVYTDEFTIVIGGAIILGKDIDQLLGDNQYTKHRFKQVIQEELAIAEESRLLNQIIETNKNMTYEEVFKSLNHIVENIKDL
jgi:predicted nucleotidyltransferase